MTIHVNVANLMVITLIISPYLNKFVCDNGNIGSVKRVDLVMYLIICGWRGPYFISFLALHLWHVNCYNYN